MKKELKLLLQKRNPATINLLADDIEVLVRQQLNAEQLAAAPDMRPFWRGILNDSKRRNTDIVYSVIAVTDLLKQQMIELER